MLADDPASPVIDVGDVMHQLDQLVVRLRTETDRLEDANDRAAEITKETR